MAISELQGGQGKVNITAKVIEVSEPREFQKFGNAGKVANAKISDDSGTMSLTLWNEQVDQVKAGDTVKITNGYVKEWQGEKQLQSGKFGTLEVVEGTKGNAPVAEPNTQATPEQEPAENPTKPVEKAITPEEFDEIEFEEEFVE